MHERLLVTFGDSWTWGSELDRPSTENWTYYLGQHLSAKTANLSYPASSIGHLAVQLFHYIDDIAENAREYKKIFAVGLTGTTRYLSYSQQLKEFVNITPEAVYRTSNIHESGRPPKL